MYKSIRRRETIKNVVYIGLILLVAVVLFNTESVKSKVG